MHGLVVKEDVKYMIDVKAIIRQFTIAPNEDKLHMVVGDTKKEHSEVVKRRSTDNTMDKPK